MGTHEDFTAAYTKHVLAALQQIMPLEPVQGPDVDADLCECGHDRGSHWDGRINCGWCDCHTFKLAS
jgi:hypothetical protein